MRLINVHTLEFSEFSEYSNNVPKYVIASHRWKAGTEATIRDIRGKRNTDKDGYVKVEGFAQYVRELVCDVEWLWIDTCCVNIESSQEVTEAVNSMFRWYADAEVCLAYLADVGNAENEHEFTQSGWFSRGWTLMELLAPGTVVFLSHRWETIGHKGGGGLTKSGFHFNFGPSLESTLSTITGIPKDVLYDYRRSKSLSIEERLAWMRLRKVTIEEDMFYSLLGIFDVTMPVLYGEGAQRARKRLLKEIKDSYVEHDLLAPLPQPRVRTASHVAQPTDLRYYTLGNEDFRLLTLDPGAIGDNISGRLQKHSIKSPPVYYALSYVWGQEPSIHQTIINDERKLIQPNLYHALQRIRPTKGQYSIWVDALCINQADSLERSMQVRQMAKIYNGASGSWIWLGEEDATSIRALEFIVEITSDKFRWADSWWRQAGFAALAQLLERPWFRRGWVIQEAAFSKNSSIRCGDREVHMDHFVTAIKTVRDRLRTVSLSSSQILANFCDSPAVKLIETITSVFWNTSKEDVLRRRMSLETLIEMSTYSETSDPRDTIYALLNLASDIASPPQPHQSDTIIPDYTKSVLDVFAEFVAHCCSQSGKLDVICRPWAPSASISIFSTNGNNEIESHVHTTPSWILCRDKLPFGDPAWRGKYRIHGNPLITRENVRCYFADYGSSPQITLGRTPRGTFDGSLLVKGLMLGRIAERSARMADGIITKGCLDILKATSDVTGLDRFMVPDTIWRTLCADRDEKGERAPRLYQTAALHLLKMSCDRPLLQGSAHLLDEVSSIDPEELLDLEMPVHVEQFLKIVRDVVWNRRIFRLEWQNDVDKSSVGLVPRNAKAGDHICILYGCTVPVVLRRQIDVTNASSWQLLGDAYVHGIMDGEVISSSSWKTLQSLEAHFKIL